MAGVFHLVGRRIGHGALNAIDQQNTPVLVAPGVGSGILKSLAEVGKGTIYLHWRTREALFWAVLQRESLQLLEQLIADLAADPELSLPQRLISRLFVELDGRPLVRALLMSDKEVLGALTADESVAAAQREMTGQPDYLQLLRDQGLLRPELSVEAAGHVLNCVIHGFFAGAETAGSPPLAEQATLLAFVLSRSLAVEQSPTPDQVAALGRSVTELFTAIDAVQDRRRQRKLEGAAH